MEFSQSDVFAANGGFESKLASDSALRKVIDDMRGGKCDAKELMALAPPDITKPIAEDIGAHAGILAHPIMVGAMGMSMRLERPKLPSPYGYLEPRRPRYL